MDSKKRIICQVHPNQECQFLKISKNPLESDNKPFQFLCKRCLIRNKESSTNCSMIDLEHIMESSEESGSSDEIIYNWPFLNDDFLYDKVEDILKSKETTSDIISSIEKQYSDLKRKVNDQIDEYYKYLLSLVNQVSQNYIRDVYKKISSNSLEELRNWIKNYGEGNTDDDTIVKIIKEQQAKSKLNTNIIILAIQQMNESSSSEELFKVLNKKLDCLFEKMNQRFVKNYLNMFNLLEEQNETQLEQRILLSYANTQLSLLNPTKQFQWNTFEEMEKGIQIKNNPTKIIFTKGYNMDLIKDDIEGQKKSSNWWIECDESYSNSGNRYISLYFNKKAKSYFVYDSQKPIYRVSYYGKKDIVKQGQQLAQELQQRIKQIQQRSNKLS